VKIGIFGGTFNPIHNGHLKSCEYVLDNLKLDKILIVPTKIPVHKDSNNLVSSFDRMNMISLAIQNMKKIEISDIEIKRDELSYTYITVEELQKNYPNDKLFLIIGYDSYLYFHKWKNPEFILDKVFLVVMKRDDSVKYNLNLKKYKEKIIFVNNSVIQISSTEIRTNISKKKITSEFLPKKVVEYIQEKELYLN